MCHASKNMLNRLTITTIYQEIGLFVNYCSSFFISIFHVNEKLSSWTINPKQNKQTYIHFLWTIFDFWIKHWFIYIFKLNLMFIQESASEETRTDWIYFKQPQWSTIRPFYKNGIPLHCSVTFYCNLMLF